MRIRTGPLRLLPVLAVFLLSLSAFTQPASAAENKYAGLVIDGNTGKTLFAKNADARRYPASLTKMMTLYVLFEELEAKRLTLTTKLSVSANAARQPPSKLGVKAGTTIKVEDAILALVTKSANDVAVVVAEHIGGSVSGFAARMNRDGARARHEQHHLPQPARPAGFRPVHHGARPRPAGGSAAGPLPDLLRLFLASRASPTRARASATTTGCSDRSRASTASRPATRAPPASTSSPTSSATAATSSRS